MEKEGRGERQESQFSHLSAEALEKHTQKKEDIYTDTHTYTYIYIDSLVNRHTHINISAEQKLNFLPSFTSCILNIIFQRKSLTVSSLLGTERSYLDYSLQAITKNWILSPIPVMCSAGVKGRRPEDVSRKGWRRGIKRDTYGRGKSPN